MRVWEEKYWVLAEELYEWEVKFHHADKELHHWRSEAYMLKHRCEGLIVKVNHLKAECHHIRDEAMRRIKILVDRIYHMARLETEIRCLFEKMEGVAHVEDVVHMAMEFGSDVHGYFDHEEEIIHLREWVKPDIHIKRRYVRVIKDVHVDVHEPVHVVHKTVHHTDVHVPKTHHVTTKTVHHSGGGSMMVGGGSHHMGGGSTVYKKTTVVTDGHMGSGGGHGRVVKTSHRDVTVTHKGKSKHHR